MVVFGTVLTARYYFGYGDLMNTIATAGEKVDKRHYPIKCSNDYEKEKDLFKGKTGDKTSLIVHSVCDILYKLTKHVVDYTGRLIIS